MGKDESVDERARAIEWLREVEASAAELVEVGDLLFRDGEPSDPALLPRYQLYSRVNCSATRARARGGITCGQDRRCQEALT